MKEEVKTDAKRVAPAVSKKPYEAPSFESNEPLDHVSSYVYYYTYYYYYYY